MGLLKTAATAVSTVSSVAKSVFGIVQGVGKIGTGILKSTVGKFALGAGTLAILSSNPTGEKGGSFFSKIADKFKSFVGGIGASVAEKAGTTVLNVAAVTTGAGKAVNEAVEAVSNDTERMPGLAQVVATGSFDTPEKPAAPAEPAPAAEEPAAQAAETQPEYELG